MTETQRKPVPRNDKGELDTAVAYLDFQRDSLVKKLDDLDEQSARRELVPTGTNLLGLVQHMIVGERYWFGHHVAAVVPEPVHWDWTMRVPGDRTVPKVIAEYRTAIAESDAIVRSIGDLDARVARPVDGQALSLRWVLAHVTTETARHAGHADILRELLDGVTGR